MIINTLIIGAGLAGLTAARQLQDNAITYMLAEKSSTVGGRLATVDIGDYKKIDVGAQFFSADSERFQAQIEDWIQQGLAYEIGHDWTDGSMRKYIADGHSRYAIKDSMAHLTEFLAEGINHLYLKHQVTNVQWSNDAWSVDFGHDNVVYSKNLIVTTPAPIAVDLLSRVKLSDDPVAELKRIHYPPNLTGVFVIDGKHHLPKSGGLQPADDKMFQWIGDNNVPQLSDSQHILVVQTKRIWSKQNFSRSDDAILSDMIQALQQYLDANATVTESLLKRWKYSVPTTTYPHTVLQDQNMPVLFAGDAFGGRGRMEGAYLSGYDAGQTIIEQLTAVED
ncbi:MAG: FAD-dependent oxidoreductase [Chloroflexota bacterium]